MIVLGPVRTLLARHPRLLKSNRAYFEIQRFRAYRGIRVRPELCRRPELVRALADDGVVVLPGYLAEHEVRPIRDACFEVVERARAGDRSVETFSASPAINFRVPRAHRAVPITSRFFDDPLIREVVDATLSPDAVSYRREIEYRFGEGAAQADLFHFDNWRPIFKAFLYLDDVSEDQAPFVYLRRTHHLAPWRYRHDLAFDVDGPTGSFGHFFPQEVRALRAQHGWTEQICTGPAGTLVLGDFRGLHRGTPLRRGHRLVLTNTFDRMNPPAA